MKISLSNKRVQLCKHYNKNIYITSDHMKKNVLLNIIRKNFWKNVIFIVNFKFYVSTINGRSNLFNNIVKSMKTLLSMTKWDLKFWFDYYFSFSFTEIKYDQTNFVISSYIYICDWPTVIKCTRKMSIRLHRRPMWQKNHTKYRNTLPSEVP